MILNSCRRFSSTRASHNTIEQQLYIRSVPLRNCDMSFNCGEWEKNELIAKFPWALRNPFKVGSPVFALVVSDEVQSWEYATIKQVRFLAFRISSDSTINLIFSLAPLIFKPSCTRRTPINRARIGCTTR